jgi:hypothetical protein
MAARMKADSSALRGTIVDPLAEIMGDPSIPSRRAAAASVASPSSHNAAAKGGKGHKLALSSPKGGEKVPWGESEGDSHNSNSDSNEEEDADEDENKEDEDEDEAPKLPPRSFGTPPKSVTHVAGVAMT